MTKSFVKRSLTFVLLVAALLCVAAPALAYPKWISRETRYSIERNKKQKNIKAVDYYVLKIYVTYKNNSKDQIIKAFFNKKMTVTCDVYGKALQQFSNGKRWPTVSFGSRKYSKKWTNVSKCEVYPGQSYKLVYTFNIDLRDLSYEKFKDYYRLNVPMTPQEMFNRGPEVKNVKTDNDFQVRTEKL